MSGFKLDPDHIFIFFEKWYCYNNQFYWIVLTYIIMQIACCNLIAANIRAKYITKCPMLLGTLKICQGRFFKLSSQILHSRSERLTRIDNEYAWVLNKILLQRYKPGRGVKERIPKFLEFSSSRFLMQKTWGIFMCQSETLNFYPHDHNQFANGFFLHRTSWFVFHLKNLGPDTLHTPFILFEFLVPPLSEFGPNQLVNTPNVWKWVCGCILS